MPPMVLKKDKTEKKEHEARGEYFNVFENLHFTRPEEHLHTPILRMLLDKNANHGVGDRFLKAFIDMVVRKLNPNFQYDVTSSNIEYKDKYIGKISEDGKYSQDIFASGWLAVKASNSALQSAICRGSALALTIFLCWRCTKCSFQKSASVSEYFCKDIYFLLFTVKMYQSSQADFLSTILIFRR